MEGSCGEIMKRYRIVIRPIMSFSSPLQSDTLFGAFCWSYRYSYGEEALTELLDAMKKGSHLVIFSNAFPKSTLPLPLGIRDTLADFEKIENKEERRKAYQNHKKIKSAKYVEKDWFEKICKGDYAGFTKGLVDEGVQEATVMHNMVSRDVGIVKKNEDDQSGNLYDEDEFFMEAGREYDVYMDSSLEEETLKQVVQLMFLLGIGKNKSIGKGAFELLEWHQENKLFIENANAFVTLSNFVPAKNDPVNGQYKIITKYGKLDREYASSDIPFKKPILFLQAGAVFYEENVREYYGRCVENVSVMEGVVVSGYAMVVPMKLAF